MDSQQDPLDASFDMVISLHTFLGFWSAGLLVYGLAQISKLWLAGSKISNRKRVFFSIISLLLLRLIWTLLPVLGLTFAVPPMVSEETPNLQEDLSLLSIFIELLATPSFYGLMVSRILYLFPLSQVFRSSAWLLLNWFELYQKEKLRKKLPRGKMSGELYISPKERRAKAHQRQKELNRLSRRFVLAVALSSFLSALLWCLHSAAPQLLPVILSQALDHSSALPPLPEALLALSGLLSLLYLCDCCFRRLGSLSLASATHSHKLKRHNLLALGLSLSAALYLGAVTITGLSLEVDGSTAGKWLFSLRMWELLHCAIVLRLLGSPSLSLKAPFPSETKAITQDWLTTVLHENGHLRRGIDVTAFWTENLKGGCHFKVSRVNLRYSKDKHDGPKTVVVKILYWDKPVLERALLYLKCLLDVEDDREVMYLKSYQMEHLFYKRQVYDSEQGLKIPQVYFNLEDVFNNRFGMVCQDLSSLEDGQPHGFPLPDCEIFLQHLAQFHASHWGVTDSPGAFNGWHEAGYWTGDKREATKTLVADGWRRCWGNFPDLNLRADFPELGATLLRRLEFVRREFLQAEQQQYRTLCHGDFKISNLFIGNLASALLRSASLSFSRLHASSYSDFAVVRSGDGSTTELSDDPDTPNPDPVDFESRDVYAIDWQWFGLGNCCIDVAAFLMTTPNAASLGRIDHLAEVYHRALLKHLPERFSYPFELFSHHFDLAVVDFCCYCITAKWSSMTPEDFENNARKVHDGLHLRSFPHMGMIIHRTSQIIAKWHHRFPE